MANNDLRSAPFAFTFLPSSPYLRYQYRAITIGYHRAQRPSIPEFPTRARGDAMCVWGKRITVTEARSLKWRCQVYSRNTCINYSTPYTSIDDGDERLSTAVHRGAFP